MSISHYAGGVLVLALVTCVGVWSGRRVKTAVDFNVGGRRTPAPLVMSALIGTLVGGASTIGTAQLAFRYGLSAWWFTLGGGAGCLLMASCFVRPLYESGVSTLPQMLARKWGDRAALAATVLTSLGGFLGIVAQMLSGAALIASVAPIGHLASTLLIVALMLAYVGWGGVWGAGYVGVVKIVLLYTAVGACGVMAINIEGGVGVFHTALPHYFDMFSRGVARDVGAALSPVFGILTTQAYIQAAVSARSLRAARGGVLASAAMVPLIGIAGVFVGMYMRLHYPDIAPSTALPLFVMNHLPPLLAGAVMATLLVALLGTGAGVALGLSSMICGVGRTSSIAMSRGVIVAILLCAAAFSWGGLGTMILDWSFLSMGLRASVAFWPMCAVVFIKRHISSAYVLASMIAGPAFVLAGKFACPSVDPLFPGMAASAVVLAIGVLKSRKD
ncbi:MAG: hypothetical protein LBR38_03360 [Synergistaceae bacterium]|jgi:SSS family solute:Na+ symporter|nr:hypothetical protein [Synergistaceae bacterium]